MAAFLMILSIATYAGLVYSIPPPQCFAKFRWDDCGKPPTPVLYYWKPGSRCEVGIWRGCLPNMNMFKDEYECVTTCIFTVRAADADFHQINADDDDATIDNYGGLGVSSESDDSNESDDANEGGDTGGKDDNVTTVEGGTGGAYDTTTDSADNLDSTENKSDDSGDAATTPKDTAADAESTTESEVPITSESESESDSSTTESASESENESETTTEETPPIEPDS